MGARLSVYQDGSKCLQLPHTLKMWKEMEVGIINIAVWLVKVYWCFIGAVKSGHAWTEEDKTERPEVWNIVVQMQKSLVWVEVPAGFFALFCFLFY